MMTTDLPLTIRASKKEDIKFIAGSWLRSYKPFSDVNSDVYDLCQPRLMNEIIENGQIVIVANKLDEDHIFGYMVCNFKLTAIHYIYIKQPFRRFGLATMLYNTLKDKSDVVFYTHKTDAVKYFVGAAYNPYIIMKG